MNITAALIATKTMTFGVHVIDNPAGTFSFAGDVPCDLGGKSWPTFDDAKDALFHWIDGVSADLQRRLVAAMRADVFTEYMNR